MIEDNEEALKERLNMFAQARDRIILSTFDFHADKSGKDGDRFKFCVNEKN